jgi:hypothetical protein
MCEWERQDWRMTHLRHHEACLAPDLRPLMRHLAAVARYLCGVALASPLDMAVKVTSSKSLHWLEVIQVVLSSLSVRLHVPCIDRLVAWS